MIGCLRGSATAILDRFLHHAEIVSITGKSYRLRNQAAHGDPPGHKLAVSLWETGNVDAQLLATLLIKKNHGPPAKSILRASCRTAAGP